VFKTDQICHAPARLCVDAHMFDLALGYAAVCLLRPLWSAKGAKQAGFGVRLAASGLQAHHLCSCYNFKLNRTAGLTERRQLLRA
jgi:hypothetical protein